MIRRIRTPQEDNMSVRIIEPAFDPAPPLPPAIRKGPNGRREQLVDGKWVPVGPTERQRKVWEAVQEHGGQTAAARALGITQGAVRTSLVAYKAAAGVDAPLPRAKTGPPKGTRPTIDRHEYEHSVGMESSSSTPGAVTMTLHQPEGAPHTPATDGPASDVPAPATGSPAPPQAPVAAHGGEVLPARTASPPPALAEADQFSVGFAAGVLTVMAHYGGELRDTRALATAAAKALAMLDDA